MSESAILIACVVCAVAGFVQGLSGFGFGIVSMAILPMMLGDYDTAFSLAALLALVIPIFTFLSARKGFQWRSCVPLTVASVIGATIGFGFTYLFSDAAFFIRAFGFTLISFAIVDLILTRALKRNMPAWMAWPCGLVGGIVGGAFNVGGPPVVAFCYSQPWTKQQIVATLQVAFLASTASRILLMTGTGYFEKEVVVLALIAFVPVVIGIFLGSRLLDKTPLKWLRFAVFAVVILLGFQYLLFPQVAGGK